MEQAVLLANQIHNRDQVQYQRELDDHTLENIRLKKFLKVLTKRQRTNHGNVVRPVRPSGSRKTRRRNRGKRQSIDFRISRRDTLRRVCETPGEDHGPTSRYSPSERSLRDPIPPCYSPKDQREQSHSPRQNVYKGSETRRFLE